MRAPRGPPAGDTPPDGVLLVLTASPLGIGPSPRLGAVCPSHKGQRRRPTEALHRVRSPRLATLSDRAAAPLSRPIRLHIDGSVPCDMATPKKSSAETCQRGTSRSSSGIRRLPQSFPTKANERCG